MIRNINLKSLKHNYLFNFVFILNLTAFKTNFLKSKLTHTFFHTLWDAAMKLYWLDNIANR